MLQKHNSRQLLDLKKISPEASFAADDLGNQAISAFGVNDPDPPKDNLESSTRSVITAGYANSRHEEVYSVQFPVEDTVPGAGASVQGAPNRAHNTHNTPTEPELRGRSELPASSPAMLPVGKRRRSTTHVYIDGVLIQRKDQAQILEQTLQLLFACEVLIFVEYMEIFTPVLYGACIGSLWQLPNAKYNVMLMDIPRASIESNVISSFAYAAAESFSFVSMYWVIKKKYGILVLYLLAFVLETYWMTLQGKLIGCFITIMSSVTIHQGIDFMFRFDYNGMLGVSGGSGPGS